MNLQSRTQHCCGLGSADLVLGGAARRHVAVMTLCGVFVVIIQRMLSTYCLSLFCCARLSGNVGVNRTTIGV